MMQNIIQEKKILDILKNTKNPTSENVLGLLKKAKAKRGLNLEEVGVLVNLKDPALRKKLFSTAAKIKDEVYGERLVFFAPLYVSDFCINDCDYCNFHLKNQDIKRKKLTLKKIGEQARFLINMGHKRLLLEFGEDPVNNHIDYVVSVIKKIYSVKTKKGNIRRVNVNIAATTVDNYRKLKQAKIGTYQLFQETYHAKTYVLLHHGPKADYQRQIMAPELALTAGLDDIGLGVLFGLYDWRFEVLALVEHAQYLEKKFQVGPHTISVPRFQNGPTITYDPEYRVSDEDFLKLIAILRIAVPYTGMIISTREKPQLRKFAFKIGISQASAASVTSPGGYNKKASHDVQFEVHDTRQLCEVIKSILDDKLLPSFCTACYRLGRTGKDFMSFSKTGQIRNFCRPNGLLTFAEYLEDFAKNGLYEKGKALIKLYLNKIDDDNMRKETQRRLIEIEKGKRDLYF